MTTYIISYDLVQNNGPEKYTELIKQIKSFGAWAKICESLWAIKTTTKAKDIRDHLKKYIDSNDRLFVIKSGSESAWANVICSNERLKDNL